VTDGGAPPQAGFEVVCDTSLRREGLRGRAWVHAEGATLHIRGSKAGAIAVPAGLVDRLRFGQVPTRSAGPASRALIWRKGLDRPLFLTTLDREYGPIMRGFAGQVASGGLGRIERGPSPLQLYLAYPGILLALVGMTVGGVYEALRGGTLWYWAFVAAMAVVVFYAVRMVRAAWPRPVRDLAELDDILPPG
jgi:hypothetical protein